MATTLDASKSILVPSAAASRYGVSGDTIPGSKIAMHVLTVQPGETITPGNDLDTEAAAYIVSGQARILSGKGLSDGTDVGAGDFYFTPVQLPHVIQNDSAEPVKMVLAYSLDPTFMNKEDTSKASGKTGVQVVKTPLDTNATAQTRGMKRIPAICAETVGARQIWMCHLSVNPHERGQPHHHGNTHTAAYTISGRARICFGPNFDDFIEPGPGDFAFDPPGLVHLVDHPFDDEPWQGVLARCPQNTVVNHAE